MRRRSPRIRAREEELGAAKNGGDAGAGKEEVDQSPTAGWEAVSDIPTPVWAAQLRGIDFPGVKRTVDDPSTWTCAETCSTEDLVLCLGDGRVLASSCAPGIVRSLECRLIMQLNEKEHAVFFVPADKKKLPMKVDRPLSEAGPLQRVRRALDGMQHLTLGAPVRNKDQLFGRVWGRLPTLFRPPFRCLTGIAWMGSTAHGSEVVWPQILLRALQEGAT